ncbi:MAG: SNF2 helicase associated domain-containing protein [Acholeplasmatales bacterium]|nr:SNF2 helicase associated domain-containing protein [Acholeplasmatales bacterium]
MSKIEISEIRKSADSLKELNEGYKLYQNNEFEEFEFEIVRIPTLSFKASAIFNDERVTITYAKEVIGDCSCNLKGLCRHEICLFFNLRDKLNTLFNDKKSEMMFYDNARQDEFMQDLMEINIQRNVFEYTILPVLSIKQDKLSLLLKFSCRDEETEFVNLLDFLEMLDKKDIYTIKNKYRMEYKYFDDESRKIISTLYLVRDSITVDGNTSFVPDEFLNAILNLNLTRLYYNNGSYQMKVEFSYELPKIKLLLEEDNLTLNNYDFKIIITKSKSYVLLGDVIYVISPRDLMFAKLLEYFTNKKELELNKNNKEIFLNNFYPLYKNQISTLADNKREEIIINTYLTYEAGALKLHYDGDFEEDTFYLKKKNYKLLVRNLGFLKSNEYKIIDFDTICDILNTKLDLFEEYGSLFIDDNIKKQKFYKMNSNKLRFHLTGSIITLTFEGMKYNADELKSILIAYKENKHYVQLENGTIISIDPDTAELFTKLVEELGVDNISDNIQIPLYQAYFISSRYKDLIESNQLLEKFSNDMLNYNLIDYPLDDSLKNYLRDYQLQGFKWLKILSSYNLGGVLADDMGLGKTLEVISLIDTFFTEKSSIVIAPTSLIFNWEMEFKKFAPQIPVEVIYGLTRDEDVIRKAYEQKKVLITSYESLRMDIDKYEGLSFKTIIIDEAQFIKNPDALKTIACKKLKGESKFALTGTPIENSLMDLWSIFDFILPGYMKTKREFAKNYENFENKQLLSELNKKASPFILRRLKSDVLDLKEKVEIYAYSTMSAEERKLYDAYLLEVQKEINGESYQISHVLSLLTRLRELACEPRLFLDDVKTKNSKLDLLMDIVQEKISDNHKMLIFSQFTSMFDFMTKRLDELGIKYFVLTGKTPAKERIDLVNEFNANEDIKVFLISLKAGGTGLTLTSADTVIHYDPWWNIAAMNQATDRTYRIGQKNQVNVIKLINKDTIEDRIVELQNRKQMLTDEVISEEDFVKRLSKEDLKNLFK